MDTNPIMGVKNVIPVAGPETVEREKPVRSTSRSLKEIEDIVRKNNSDSVILSASEKALVNAIEHINKVISGANVELQFSIHKSTNSVIVTLIDKDTKDVILEIPPQNILDAFAKRMELNGLYLDERR